MGSNLAQRVQNNNLAQQNGGQKTVFDQINDMKGELARALPKHMDADRIARIATTVIKQTPALGRCTPVSLLGALMTASQLGLEPGPLGEAYLVPYGNTVTFIPGYRGLIKLAWQSGQVKNIAAHVVYESDTFDYGFGLSPTLEHKPAMSDRGKPVAVYAVVQFMNGGHAFDVMSVADVEAIRARSKAGKSGPWVTDWAEMAKKTVIKRVLKMVPLSSELHNLAQAANLDGTARTDVTANVDDFLPEYVENDAFPGELVEEEVNTETGELSDVDREWGITDPEAEVA
jgi:recombination protein RecT